MPTVPPPRITSRGVLLSAVAWVLYAAVMSVPIAIAEGRGYGSMFIGQLFNVGLYVLLALPVWWLVVRRMDGRSWGAKLAVHAVALPLYAFLHYDLSILAYLLSGGAPDADVGLFTNRNYIILGSGLVYVTQFAAYHGRRAQRRLRWEEQRAAELTTLAKERELAVLRAQLNPHFLFNTLNSINAMVTQSPEATREMIAGLAGLLRYALDAGARALVPLADELDFTRAYLDLEAHRFSDRLRVRYDVDDEALAALVPPMVLQPLAENAVKHGIAPEERGGTLTVRVRRVGDRAEVAVEDDGRGAAPEAVTGGTGIGLRTTDASLRRTFGDAAALEAAPLPERGFRAAFSIPLRPAPDATAGADASKPEPAVAHPRPSTADA